MESCFNIYKLPHKWLEFSTFHKKVQQSALGGDANKEAYVGLTTLPMGFQGSVEVAQAVLCELEFGVTGLDLGTELRKDKPLPVGTNISVLCLDGFDFISVVTDALTTYEWQPSVQHGRFVETYLEAGAIAKHVEAGNRCYARDFMR